MVTRHIVLVGLMGAGKTTVGLRLARRLNWLFQDSDTALEATHGRTAREIAAHEGIERLHELEAAQLLAALAVPGPTVIAAAASTVENAAVRTALGAPDVAVVWLRGTLELLASRQRLGRHRPALGPDPATLLGEQAARRAPLFEALEPIVIDVDEMPPRELVERLLARLAATGAR